MEGKNVFPKDKRYNQMNLHAIQYITSHKDLTASSRVKNVALHKLWCNKVIDGAFYFTRNSVAYLVKEGL
jgi:hypothetical protein